MKLHDHVLPLVVSLRKTKRTSEDWKKRNMKQSKRGSSLILVHCNLCGNDFSIASGGVHEVI